MILWSQIIIHKAHCDDKILIKWDFSEKKKSAISSYDRKKSKWWRSTSIALHVRWLLLNSSCNTLFQLALQCKWHFKSLIGAKQNNYYSKNETCWSFRKMSLSSFIDSGYCSIRIAIQFGGLRLTIQSQNRILDLDLDCQSIFVISIQIQNITIIL